MNARELSCVASAVGLSSEQLRGALDRLPGAGHAPARPDAPSPLTPRETEMIQKLSAGKVYTRGWL